MGCRRRELADAVFGGDERSDGAIRARMSELTKVAAYHGEEPRRQDLMRAMIGAAGELRQTCELVGDPHIAPFGGNWFDIHRSPPSDSENPQDPALLPFTMISSWAPGKWKEKIQVCVICDVRMAAHLPCMLPSRAGFLPSLRGSRSAVWRMVERLLHREGRAEDRHKRHHIAGRQPRCA